MRFKIKRNAPSKSTTSTTQKQLNRRRMMRWLWSSTLIICSVAGGSLAAWILSNGIPGAGAKAQQVTISPEALAQIEALLREKAARAGTQRKMDSQLIYELKMRSGAQIAEGVQALETDIPYNDDGKAVLDLKATVSDSLLNQLRTTYGADIVNSIPALNSVRIQVDIDQIEAIAALPDVTYIQPKQEGMTSQASRTAPGFPQTGTPQRGVVDDRASGLAGREARVRSLLTTALQEGPMVNVGTGQGSRSSEGDVAHRANSARGTFNIDGTGIKIGVLSDGVTNLAASQAAGDLGPVTVLPGQAGSGDEGTAMLEIVHDLAPGAQLYFATAFNGITSFAQNIRALRAAGCDIIVDDVFYFVETPFQDGQAPGVVSNTNGGVVTQAVNDVTASGALYFSSAGNSGNLNDGTSGVWEGNFVDGGDAGGVLTGAGRIHNFGGQLFTIQTAAGQSQIDLYWSDPLGGSSNDYDLFRLNSTGTAVTAASTGAQDGTQDPFEAVGQPTAVSLYVIVKFSGADRFLHLNTNRGRLSIATAGQTHGHSAAANAFGCAATPAAAAFPNPFSSTNVVENFSSDGPRRIFYQADGTPITPGDFLATGGLLRQKPDITAADGVAVTGVGGFPSPFFGTSAAAPHAAAIAGLLKSANPSFTPAQIRAALTGSAIDIEGPGVDRDSGAGIIDAFAALQFLGVPGFANIELGAVTASENPGDGNGQIDAGEGARLAIPLKNSGVLDATGVTASLTTSTPGVIITQPATAGYPNLPALGGLGTSAAPFLFTLASDAPCPLTINFTLTVSYTGGSTANPKAFNFTVQTGPQPITISSTMDANAPPSGTGFTGSTGTIGARHFRDGVASACAPAKPFPGTTQPGTRQYDAYTFETCPTSAGGCVTVTLSGTNASNLFTAAYSGTFNPNDLSQGYLADAGASAASRTYSFNIPPGQQTFTVVVTDVPIGPPSGTSYTLNVSGACIGSCPTVNHLPVAISQNVTVEAGSGCVADASINNGSFDPDGDPLTITQTPAGPYPLGATNVLLTVTDSKGASSQSSSTVTVVAPTTTTVSAPPVQYSDVVTLSSTTFAQFCPASTPAGSVEFFVDNVSVGAAPIGAGGVAAKNTQILLAAGSYPLKAVFTSSNPLILGSTATSTLTVAKEIAVVTPSTSDPSSVEVSCPGGKSRPFTLTAKIKESPDGSPGDISKATPVTFTLTPTLPGAPTITRTATTSGGGTGGTLTASATFNDVKVNFYDVTISVGGNFYTGSGSDTVAVYDPTLGFVTGDGSIVHDGKTGNLEFDVKYNNRGGIQGEFEYTERRSNGNTQLKSTSMQSLSIAGDAAVFIGKAKLNGATNYTFIVTIFDKGDPGRRDTFGLKVIAPNGTVVSDLTFDPITLSGGNIQVHSSDCDDDHRERR